jgi:LacI family transcriptional regulator
LATIYDVARKAGVSPKTVSRVLNGDAPVNEKTREAVQTAMAELGYVPSNAARSMRSQKSGLIGLITGAISASPPGEPVGLPDIYIVQGIQRALAEHGLTLLISDTGGHMERVPELVQTFLEHRVEGLIYVADYHREVMLPLNLKSRHVVLANCYDAVGTPAVLPDDEGGEHALVSGLIARGHRRIGFLTLPEHQAARALRAAGYQRALAEAGIDFDPDLVIAGALADPAHEYDYLWDALDRLLRRQPRPSVICCANDKMAMRLYALLRERGLRIPHDISVAGYDDYRIICEHLQPTLTSVELPYGAMGLRAAEKLMRLINGTTKPNEAAKELVSGPVVWRDSVKTSDATVTLFKSRRSETS